MFNYRITLLALSGWLFFPVCVEFLISGDGNFVLIRLPIHFVSLIRSSKCDFLFVDRSEEVSQLFLGWPSGIQMSLIVFPFVILSF